MSPVNCDDLANQPLEPAKRVAVFVRIIHGQAVRRFTGRRIFTICGPRYCRNAHSNRSSGILEQKASTPQIDRYFVRPLEILGVSILAVDLAVGGITFLLSNPFLGSWAALLRAMLLILLLGIAMLLASRTWRPRFAVNRARWASVEAVVRVVRVCMYCGSRNPEEASYCPTCGKELVQPV